MKEKHFAYKITRGTCGFVYPHFELQKDKMLDLLQQIQNQYSEGLFWVFKQFDNLPQEQLCIIDCENHRIYYHYSGEVEAIQSAIDRLSQ